jgi:hypothetical protein
MSKPFRFTKPGIYTGLLCSSYYDDPCPTPSLTQSLVKELNLHSPRHAWAKHPRLNPRYEPDESTKFNIANAAHWHLIGRGKEMHVVEYDDWRTKAAKEERERANAAGKCAVLRKQFDLAGEMAEACLDQLNDRGLVEDWDPKKGDGEVVLAWREGDTWFRSLIDWLPHHRRTVWDYKTTAKSAAPNALDKRMADGDWPVQAATHERGLNVLDKSNVGKRRHLFVCQECDFPYALTVSEISEEDLTFGRMDLARAVEIWQACMATGTHKEAWPMYDLEIQYPHYPGWEAQRKMNSELDWRERRVEAPMLTDLSGG